MPEIKAVLEDCGVQQGSWIPGIDFAHCEHTLRSTMDELAWVGMRHTGNRLVVEVMERTPEPEMQNTRKPLEHHRIPGWSNCFIFDLSWTAHENRRRSGTGDLLVSGLYTDETEHTGIKHAMGSIIGQYKQTEKFTCTYEQNCADLPETRRTSTWICSPDIPLGSTEPPFDDYIRTSGYHWFSLFRERTSHRHIQKHFTNTTSRTFILTPAEAAQNAEEQIQRYEDNFLSQVEILDKKTTALETESGVEYTVTYTLQGEIGVQQELYLH
ncbi:MAG: sporulation protein YqfD [Ruminococcus callidus]